MTHSFAVSDIECPVCKTLMEAAVWDALWWYYCPTCGHQSPAKGDPSEARAAAMKLERPKGEWIEGEYVGEVGYEIKWRCSSCGFAVLSEEYPAWHFCPNCGADMGDEDT